jgi:hypothetical protein
MVHRLPHRSGLFLLSVVLPACGGGGGSSLPAQTQQPPVITRLAISPDAPKTLDMLVADFAATDANGDTLTYTATWTRNGNPLTSATGTTVSPGQHFKGDLIQLRLEVSDGHASTPAQVSVTIQNTAPGNVVPLLQPAAPTGATDLLMRYSNVGVDADGDQVTASYAWRRNGAVIAGQTGDLLLHTQFVPGDVVSAVLTLSDGQATGTGEVAVTIQDAPPIVDVSAAPDTAAVGEPMTFVATATDDDGGPRGNFVLGYGPAGMTVEPDTGLVSWVPSGPLFATDTEVHWGITVDRPAAAVAASTTIIVDPDREQPMLRLGLLAPVARGLQIGDFDGDGANEALVLSERGLYELAYEGGRYRQTWAYPFAVEGSEYPVLSALAAGDIDGDGSAELFAGQFATIIKIDARRMPVASTALQTVTGSVLRELELADLDRDGDLELIALSSFNRLGMPWVSSALTLLDPVTLAVLHEFEPAIYGGSLAVANVDNDAALEIITGSGLVIDGATWQVEWRYAPGFGMEVGAGDTSGDGIAEIVANVDGTVQAYNAVSQSLSWSIENAATDAVLVTDVTGDAVAEIIVGDGPSGGREIKVFRQNPGLETASLLYHVGALGDDVPSLAVGDLDGDGGIELLWGSGHAEDLLAVGGFGPGLEVEWTTAGDSPQELSGPFAGGVLAVSTLGSPAVVFATSATGINGMRPFAMDPDSGDFTFGREFPIPFNGVFALTAADYDRDGSDELLWASTDLGSVSHVAYDFFTDTVEWSSTLLSQDPSGAAIVHADLNGDGDEDIVSINYDGRVRAFDPTHDIAIWTSPRLGNGRAIAAVDVNHFGAPEIIVAAEYRIGVYSQDTAGTFLLVAQTPELSGLVDMLVGDVDGDGETDIFALRAEQARAVDRFDADLQPLGSFDTGVLMNGIALEESGFARKNLLLFSEGRGPFIVAVDSASGTEIWRSPGLFGEIARSGLHLVDTRGDGTLRMSVATSYGVLLTR